MSSTDDLSALVKEEIAELSDDRPIAEACPKLKNLYEECFNRWYSSNFLRGDTRPACEREWEAYRKCVEVVLQKKGLLHLQKRPENPMQK